MGARMKRTVAEILSGFDRAMDRIEAMRVPSTEKKRLVREWLRSRLAEMPDTATNDAANNRAERSSRKL